VKILQKVLGGGYFFDSHCRVQSCVLTLHDRCWTALKNAQ